MALFDLVTFAQFWDYFFSLLRWYCLSFEWKVVVILVSWGWNVYSLLYLILRWRCFDACHCWKPCWAIWVLVENRGCEFWIYTIQRSWILWIVLFRFSLSLSRCWTFSWDLFVLLVLYPESWCDIFGLMCWIVIPTVTCPT